MIRTALLTTAAVMCLSAAANAAATPQADANTQSAFSQAVKSIKDWFGSDAPEQIQPAAGATTADADDMLQVPPQYTGSPADIEPAAGNVMDDDIIQVPPQYHGPATDPAAKPRASAFDSNLAVAAFGDAPQAADIANIAPAAGDGALDVSKLDCAAILKAADSANENDVPDTALIEACEAPQNATQPVATPQGPGANPAQPAFEPAVMPQSLPATQPAAGEPPVGGAAMPGQAPIPEQPAQ